MTAFVLVHGSGQNAGSWARVAALLVARGHAVAMPELPKQQAGFRLADHAAVIADAIQAPDAMIVAHSLCGVFLPLVPVRRACAGLVFVAAVIPEPGRTVREQFAADASMFHPEWIRAGQRWSDRTQVKGLAEEFLFHDCDAEALAFGLGTMEPMDTRQLVTEPAPFAQWPGVPSVAIVASRDRTLTPEWVRRRSRDAFGREAIEVDSGHCPHVSQPAMIGALLERLARDCG